MSDVLQSPIDDRQTLIEERARELERDFSYAGYQVVRKELFAHMRDPAVVIRFDSVTFNTACINGLEDTIYIHIMVNLIDKRMAIQRCDENDKGALRWCVPKPDKRRSRKMTSKKFTEKLYRDLGWNTDCRYKILGYRIKVEGQTIYVFDLTETEIFLEKNAHNMRTTETGVDTERESRLPVQEGQAVKHTSRKGYLPEEWENSYGLPVEVHNNYKQINLKEGYLPISTATDEEKEDNHGK